jgi:hypothetical protein
MRTWLLAAIAVVGSLSVGVSVGVAAGVDHGMAINPSDVMTVRAYTRGQGVVVATGNCTATTCPGNLSANLLKGTPAAFYGLLDVPIEVQREADPFTLCRKIKGRGTLKNGEFVAQLVGELCHDSIRFSVSASMQIFANNAACACQDEPAAAGRLEMFGPVKSLGDQLVVPFSVGSIASFVGSAGRPSICCP